MTRSAQLIPLPKPNLTGDVSLESALQKRRSVREFSKETLSLRQVSQILWAAQGQTAPDGGRTAPSAGALYPLETYLVVGDVRGLNKGLYKYRPRGHGLLPLMEADRREAVAAAAVEQTWIAGASIVLVFAAVYGRTTRKYGGRGKMYVHMEVGHVAQSVSLQAAAMELGTVVVGAIDNAAIRRILNLPGNEVPVCLMPIGKPR